MTPGVNPADYEPLCKRKRGGPISFPALKQPKQDALALMAERKTYGSKISRQLLTL